MFDENREDSESEEESDPVVAPSISKQVAEVVKPDPVVVEPPKEIGYEDFKQPSLESDSESEPEPEPEPKPESEPYSGAMVSTWLSEEQKANDSETESEDFSFMDRNEEEVRNTNWFKDSDEEEEEEKEEIETDTVYIRGKPFTYGIDNLVLYDYQTEEKVGYMVNPDIVDHRLMESSRFAKSVFFGEDTRPKKKEKKEAFGEPIKSVFEGGGISTKPVLPKVTQPAPTAPTETATPPNDEWQKGYLHGYAFSAVTSKFDSFEEAMAKYEGLSDKDKKKVAGITQTQDKRSGADVYSLRAGKGRKIYDNDTDVSLVLNPKFLL